MWTSTSTSGGGLGVVCGQSGALDCSSSTGVRSSWSKVRQPTTAKCSIRSSRLHVASASSSNNRLVLRQTREKTGYLGVRPTRLRCKSGEDEATTTTTTTTTVEKSQTLVEDTVQSIENGGAVGLAEEGKTLKIAYLNANSAYEVAVEGVQGEASIDNYLRLPIEQYFISDPDSITKVSANEFLFQLPQLKFFNVWVAPEVKMSVQLDEEPKTVVNIKANKCTVSGSKFIEKMRLNDRLSIKVKTSLEETGTVDDSRGTTDHTSAMKAQTTLEVWCEVVPPFNLLPKAFLEKSCNAVLRTTLKTLLKAFMVELKDDYHLWSTDESYRKERAKRSLG